MKITVCISAHSDSSGPGIEGSGFISNDPNEDFDKSSLEPSNKINFMPLKIGNHRFT